MPRPMNPVQTWLRQRTAASLTSKTWPAEEGLCSGPQLSVAIGKCPSRDQVVATPYHSLLHYVDLAFRERQGGLYKLNL